MIVNPNGQAKAPVKQEKQVEAPAKKEKKDAK
jgi:hypothetical protein